MKFSIVVANYNNGRFLPFLIDSIKKQSYKNWELIIVDDCSKDDSLDILKPYETDASIKIIKHNENKRAGGAFKSGTEAATGDIVGLMGAEDALPSNSLEEIVLFYEQHKDENLSSIYTLCADCDFETMEVLGLCKTNRGLRDDVPSILLDKSPMTMAFQTYLRHKYFETEGFSTELTSAVDQDIMYKLEEVGKVLCLPKVLYHYRQNPQGISREPSLKPSIAAKKAIVLAYFRRKAQNYPNNLSYERFLYTIRPYYRELALYQKTQSSWQAIITHFKSLQYLPGDIKTLEFWKHLYKLAL